MAKSWKRSNAAHMRLSDRLCKAACRRNVNDYKAHQLNAKAAYHRSVAEAQQHCNRLLKSDEKQKVYNYHVKNGITRAASFYFKRK